MDKSKISLESLGVARAIISAILSFIIGVWAYSELNVIEVDSSEIPSQLIHACPLPLPTKIENISEATDENDADGFMIVNGKVKFFKTSN